MKYCKWSWQKLAIKLNSAALWAWAAATVLVFIVCIKDGGHEWINAVVWGWVIISCLFIGGKILIDALAVALKKAELKANLTIGGKL